LDLWQHLVTCDLIGSKNRKVFDFVKSLQVMFNQVLHARIEQAYIRASI